MDKSQRDQMTTELIISLLSSLLFLAIYWWTTLPDWKQKAVLTGIGQFLQGIQESNGELEIQLEVDRFRKEISEWEHGNAG
jgi:hypothetical protein